MLGVLSFFITGFHLNLPITRGKVEGGKTVEPARESSVVSTWKRVGIMVGCFVEFNFQ